MSNAPKGAHEPRKKVHLAKAYRSFWLEGGSSLGGTGRPRPHHVAVAPANQLSLASSFIVLAPCPRDPKGNLREVSLPGLAIVQRIVEELGGTIAFHNNPGTTLLSRHTPGSNISCELINDSVKQVKSTCPNRR